MMQPLKKLLFLLVMLGNSQYLTTFVATISGTSVSFGAATILVSGTSNYVHSFYHAGAGKTCVVASLSGTGLVRTCTVGSTAITSSTGATFSNSQTEYTAGCYESKNALGVIYFQRSSTDYPMVRGFTLSGETATFGTEDTLVSQQAGTGCIVYDVKNDYACVIMNYITGSSAVNTCQSIGVRFSSNGSVASKTSVTQVVAANAGTSANAIAYDTAGESVYASFYNSSTQIVNQMAFSSNAYTVGTAITWSGSGSTNYPPALAFNSNNFTLGGFYRYGSSSGRGAAYIVPRLSTNASSFIGITNAAISSSATGEVAVKGGLSTTASFPTTIALGAEASLYSGTNYDRRINYDPSNNKFLAVLRTGSGGAVQVGTLSGTTMAWGTAVTFSGLSNSGSDQQVSYNSNTQSFLITFPDSDNSSYPTAMVAKISGTSVTLGTRAVISSTGTPQMYLTYDSTAQKNVIGFAKNGTNYNFGIVATIDGSNNTVSFGSEQVFDTSGQNYVTGVTYDPTSNKTLFTRINNVGGVGTVGTVSGTSISFGSDTAFGTSENPYRIETVYDASAQKLISTYVGDIGSQQVKSRVATISGTSVAFGTQVTFGDTGIGGTDFSATYAPSINAILYTTSSTSTYGQITVLTSDGTNVSVGSITQYSGVDTDYLASAFDTANSKVVVLYDVKSSNAAKYIAGDVSAAGVIGSNYFVQDDGSIATTSSTTKAGKAISTTALNLVDPT